MNYEMLRQWRPESAKYRGNTRGGSPTTQAPKGRMSKTAARKLAQQSTRYGYFDCGATLWVNCPVCRKKVEVAYSMWATDSKGKRLSKVAQIRVAVAEHLTDEH